MISMRSGMGLGDSLYLQSIARHFVGQGFNVEACSAWPDVFLPLGDRVKVSPFRRDRIDRLAHYSLRRDRTDTDQFEDCCIQAGIKVPVELRLDWVSFNSGLIEKVTSAGRPVIVVQLPRAPMDRKDGFGAELLPDCNVLQRAIDLIGTRAFIVQVGSGKVLHQFSGINLDLANRTSVRDLLDVASVAAGFLGYVSFLVPLAESFLKPSLLIWSRRGLDSKYQVISRLKPEKVLHRTSSRAVIDDCSHQELFGAVDALCEPIRYQATV